MALDLLKRSESGDPITAVEHDANFTAIETEVNNKADTGHTHTESDITDLSHDAVSLQGSPLDASVGSPADGNILVFRDLGGDWVLEAKPAGASPNVNDLGDVTITSVADNEVLAFDTATSEWINQTPAEAGLAAVSHTHLAADITDLSLDDLADVSLGTPANNEVLTWDTGTGAASFQSAAEAGLQALLAAAGVTVRSAGALDFDGGTDGQVWTVQADGSVFFEDISAHTHTLSDITDAGALAALSTVATANINAQAVTLDKIVDQAGVTPASYTNANITVSQEGIITAASSGSAGSGGLSTVGDANTAITIGDAVTGTHRRLTADSAITLTLDAQTTVGTKVAVTPKGSGVVTVQVEAGATYELPLDDTAGRTTSFVVGGYVLFECVANADTNSAVWDVVGETDHADLADNALNMNGEQITNAVMPLADDEETASFTFALSHSQQKMVRANHATTPITATVPPNSSVAFPLGTTLNLFQGGAAAVTVAAGAGVTINQAASKTLVLAEQYAVVSLWKEATDTWLLFGHLTDA